MRKIIITVDTEGPAGENAVQRLIYGETIKGENYGIEYLMKLFSRYGAKALFFVDIAEAWEYGADKISDVLKTIDASGHNTGVHIHPDHMADPNRRLLREYSYNEQKEIITKCTNYYMDVLGKKPISFRAGRYGANYDTLRILNELGYKYDFSEFYGNRRCGFIPPICVNRVTRIKDTNMLEIPVTVYKSFTSSFYSRIDKIDCSMDYEEFKTVMNKMVVCDSIDVISFFVHSFSVLNWRGHSDSPRLNRVLKCRLEKQLKWCHENGDLCFIEESNLDDMVFGRDDIVEKSRKQEEKVDNFNNEDIVDISDLPISYWFAAKRAIKIIHDKVVQNV